MAGLTDLRALVFLLLRFRRLTRFFLHFALILARLTVWAVSTRPAPSGLLQRGNAPFLPWMKLRLQRRSWRELGFLKKCGGDLAR